MQENTNKAIFLNSIILYAKLIITAIAGLLTTRFALQALGVDDFGLFSVVGGVISFIAIVNTIMISTSNRFIATAIGKGDMKMINNTFSVNVVIHVLIAVITLAVAYPLGDWYILNFINYGGDIQSVMTVFHITIIGSVISFIGVPFNGLLIAKERFLVFSTAEIIANITKVIVSYSLIYFFANKLSVYSLTICLTTAFPTFVFIVYCRKLFPQIVAFHFVKEWAPYREVLAFSVWVGYGAIATVSKNQGAALIVNRFFNTTMNTALGLANSVNSIILTFANSISKSISPQIVKSYAAGDKERSETLVVMASKYSFLILLLVASPFLVAPEWIFSLWLGVVPANLIIFSTLIIVDALIGVFNAGIPDLIFASGKIKWYQIIVNTMFLLSVLAAYYVLQAGAPAYYLQVTYIIFSLIILVLRQIALNRIVKFNNWNLIRKSYIPCIYVVILFTLVFTIKGIVVPFMLMIISIVYLLILYFTIALTKEERLFVINRIKGLIKK